MCFDDKVHRQEEMQFTPESNIFFKSEKDPACCDDCFDSGYSGSFNTPQSITRDDSLSLVESNETPKENLRLSATPKDRTWMGLLSKNTKAAQCPTAVTWCETPKLHKKDVSLRHRLAVCKSILAVNTNSTSSPGKKSETSLGVLSEQWLSTSLDSLDTVMSTLASSTLASSTLASSTLTLDPDLPLSGRKRRFLYSQVRTSTLKDGQLNSEQLSSFDRRVSLSDEDFKDRCSPSDKLSTETPQLNKYLPVSLKKNIPSPICNERNILCDSSVFSTPSQTPKYTRLVCEDSGFNSLTLDKSQDDSVDHDGSFQEILLSASRGNGETQNLLDTKRRPRLQRLNRLSTLKEGGSQSEDDLTERKNDQNQNHQKEDEVFTVAATPRTVFLLKMGTSVSSDVGPSTKQAYATPVRVTLAKPENGTPLSSGSLNSDATPLRNTPVNLSMTPALQLVHAMCQQRAHTFNSHTPSLKEELKTTAALMETPVTFRTTMPLAGLIGRKMGLGTVDILTELNKRNIKHILHVILGHLTPECIHRCGQVCKSWKEIIQQDKQACFRRRSYLSELNSSVEGSVPDADTRQALLQRSAFRTVQSLSRSSSFCTPQSGNKSLTPLENSTLNSGSGSKRDKFLEVAKTLFNDECLKPCPQCQHPARCHSVKGEGVCSSADCGFQFCTSCLCAFHGSRECASQSVNRRKKDVLIPGSAQCKRNIRRL